MTRAKETGKPDPKQDSLELARRFWSERRKEVVTREAARETIANLTGFFRVLAEWDASNDEAD